MNSPPDKQRTQLTEGERYKLFVAGVTDYAIYMLTPEGYVDSWNAGAERFKGYQAEEIIGRHFSSFFTEADRAAGLPARALRTALEQGKFESEGWRVRKDGTRFWAHVVIDPIRTGTGELIGFAKITRDITERKQAQEALHASEERFRLLVQGVTDYAIYMLSPEGMITNWNAGARRIKGYEDSEVLNTHFSRFYTDSEREAGVPARMLATAATQGRSESEGWRVRKDGTHFWAHVVIDPIYSEMGTLVGYAKVTRDITERRDAALSLERAKEALFQSQKFGALGKLTGGVAHDFNNLLGVIVSGIDLLARDTVDPAKRKIIDSMQRAATRGATLTSQLLAFARAQPLRQEKQNLNQVLNSFEAVLRRACDDRIVLDLALGSRLACVMTDATQFEAAVLNLVANARDAMPDGGRIVVSTGNVELVQGEIGALAAGAYVRIAVRDEGTGMDNATAARAIDPFFTTKGPGKGTGLGLSQVYGFAQQSGGDLTITSSPGAGTTVAFYLPAVEGDGSDEGGETEDGGAERALVVDDQPDVLEMAVELFRMMGYDVLSANNGLDALEILKRDGRIDVLFTDVQMPGLDGVALALEAHQRHPGMKIILASGFPPATLTEQSSAFHDFAFIGKPYRFADLLKLLRKAG